MPKVPIDAVDVYPVGVVQAKGLFSQIVFVNRNEAIGSFEVIRHVQSATVGLRQKLGQGSLQIIEGRKSHLAHYPDVMINFHAVSGVVHTRTWSHEGSFGTAASDTTFKVLPYRARDFFYVPLRQVLLDLLSHLLR